MTTIPIYLADGSVPGDVPQALPGRRAPTKQDQYRPLKQLSDRSSAAVAA